MESHQQPRKSRRAGTSEEQESPTENFLFVDSSKKKGTSKPDRASRSFVMQQARKQKTWSTKKFPANSSAKRSSKAQSLQDGSNAGGELSWVHYVPKNEPLHKGERVVTHRFGSPRSPLGKHSTPCRMSFCNGDFCSQSHGESGHAHALSLSKRPWAPQISPIGAGVFDPFSTLPVRPDHRAYTLLDHCSKNVVPLMIPLDIHCRSNIGRDEFLAPALRDEARGAFTHSLMCAAALHRFAMGVGTLDDILYHKAESVAKINANLSDPRLGVHDNNIAAVFNLLNIEESLLGIVSAGGGWPGLAFDPVQKTMHLNGLIAMLQQRGGLAGLSSRCLQAFILWHSIAHSIASFEQPYATLIDTHGRAFTYTIPGSATHPPPVRILRLLQDLDIDADLQEIVADTSSLSSDMTSWLDDSKCALDPIDLQQHGFLLLQRCLALLLNSDTSRSPIDQSVCLAVLIFVVRITQPADYGFRTMVSSSIPRLRAALKKTSISKWSRAPDLLLWTLTIGTLAAQDSQHFDFFAQYSTAALAEAGVDDTTPCDELLARMKGCLWLSSLMDQDVRKLWARIGIGRADEEMRGIKEEQDESPVSHVTTPDEDDRDEAAVGRLTSMRFFT